MTEARVTFLTTLLSALYQGAGAEDGQEATLRLLSVLSLLCCLRVCRLRAKRRTKRDQKVAFMARQKRNQYTERPYCHILDIQVNSSASGQGATLPGRPLSTGMHPLLCKHFNNTGVA